MSSFAASVGELVSAVMYDLPRVRPKVAPRIIGTTAVALEWVRGGGGG